MIANRFAQLRQKMKEYKIDVYLILSDDFHGSEYVGDHFKCREFITGFNGSAGSVLITQTEARLFTDGRYFLQAEVQIKGTEIILVKQDVKGEPTIKQSLRQILQIGQRLGFDGRTISAKMAEELTQIVQEKQGNTCTTIDLVGAIWNNRPKLSKESVWELELNYAGISRKEKLRQIRKRMKEKGATCHLLSSLEDIAWLFNLRGGDVKYSPFFLAYAVITDKTQLLFVNQSSLSEKLVKTLSLEGIKINAYEDIYEYVKGIKAKVLLDPLRTNHAVVQSLGAGTDIIEGDNPSILLKAIKNETEIVNLRKAHLKDGVAMTKFLYWLSKNIGKAAITEISAAEKLEEFRQMGDNYLGQSFAPIFGYQEHGAIIHYSATKESDATLTSAGLLLMDTGGHYLEGSTDITRTVSLGRLTGQQRQYYTAILRGNLNLAQAHLSKGSVGSSLDILARKPIKDLGLDYQHGTGHGVGYLLSIHEGPQSIRIPRKDVKEVAFEAGMVTSNEPGVYLSGEYGIRLENIILCKQAVLEEELAFETLTMVPFDLKCIEPEALTETEKNYLNKYHEEVRETLLPYLTKEESQWLCQNTCEL